VRPDLPFSLKSAISREYSTFFTIIALFTFLSGLMAWFSRGIPVPDRFAATLFVVGLLIYGAVRYLKKRTDVLRTEGR